MLDAVRTLTREIPRLSWFTACGETLVEAERDDARAWIAGLDIAFEGIDGVADWVEAGALAQDPAWRRDWWDAEERERRALYEEAASQAGETALLAALSAATQAASDAVHGAAAVAASRAGIADPVLHRVAAGAASQACYQGALARAAGEGDAHPFAAKLRLFAAGRWPLGVVGERCFVF